MYRSRITQMIIGFLVILVVVGCQGVVPANTQVIPANTQAVPANTQAVPTDTQAVAVDPSKLTIVWAHSTEPRTLDPQLTVTASITRNAINWYETLVTFKYGTLELVPLLATEWSLSDDGMSYTFTLRQGVKFHDGTDFTAEAVKYSFDRYKAIGQGYIISPYKSSEIIDPYHIKINLESPQAAFLQMATMIFIVSPTAGEANKTADDPWAGKWFYEHEAGTGPYQFTEWIHEQQVTMDWFPDYWGGWDPLAPRHIIHKIIKEAATQVLEVGGGDIDFAMNIPVDSVPTLKANPDLIVGEFTTLVGLYFRMAAYKGPLQDIRVRQAIQYAFNYADFEIAMQGIAYPLEGPLPSSIPYAKQYPHEYNLDKARELLSEAGYPDGGFTLNISLTTGFEMQSSSAEILQYALSQLGITLNINSGTYAVMVASWADPETTPDISGYLFYPSYADPDNFLYSLYYSGFAPPKGGNVARYNNPEVDKLLLEGQSEMDSSKRQQIYAQIQDIVVEEAIDIYVDNPGYLIVYNSRIENYKYQPAFHDTIRYYELRINPDK